MPTKVGRQEFNTALQHTDLDVRRAEQDPSLRSVLPAKADLNHDGKISGATEVDQLFTQIDSFGRNATAQDTSLLDPSGHGTQQARAMRALGQLTQNAEVMGWTASVNFDRADFSTITAPAGTPPGGQTMVAAAATLIRERKDNYGTHQPWYNLDPNHALPANVRLGGLAQSDRNPNGVWKCNLFGGNAMYVAGFEPPYYGNRGKGEYPNANQFYTFSDKYAAQFGNKVHFKMVDEVALNGLDEATKRARLTEVLRNAQPGDLLMVDHQGTDISDGGHTRVVMANDLQADGTGQIHSAQATQSEGAVRGEGLSSFTGEEHVWVLRPNRPRAGQPTEAPQAPVVATPSTPASNSTGAYTVKPGDTFTKIAKTQLGDGNRWRELQALNPGIDPRMLKVGMTLKLPS
jgi:LysM repeat protein